MQNVAAALELVARNHKVGDHDGDRAEHARRRVVAFLQQIGYGELRKTPRASRDGSDHDQPEPAARGLPERGETVAESVLSAGEETARADPRREQRKHQHIPGQLPPGHQEVALILHAEGFVNRDGRKRAKHNRENDDVDVHEMPLITA